MRFCIICGKPTDELFNNMCKTCYINNTELAEVPDRVIITLCPECFSYMFRGRWIRPEDPNDLYHVVHEATLRNLSTKIRYKAKVIKSMDLEFKRPYKITPYKRGKFSAVLTVEGVVHPKVGYFKKVYGFNIEVQWRLCPTCFKVKAQVEEAIVQVRASGRKLDEGELLRIRNLVENLLYKVYEEEGRSSLVKVEMDRHSGGLDFYFASKRIARYIASSIQKEFLASVKESYSVIGGEMTKERKKITISVRLPPFKVGSIVLYKGNPILIKDIRDGRIYAMDLGTYKLMKLGFKEAREIKECEYKRERAMVLSILDNEVQVMKLSNYEVMEIPLRRRPLWIKEGEGIDIITVDGKHYIIKGILGSE